MEWRSPTASLRRRSVAVAREALAGGEGAWIVGGAIRDAALGREVTDLDLAVAGDPAAAAKAIAREGGGHAFELSAEFATWRAVAAGRRLAGRRHRAARRDDRGRPGGARLHDRRGRGVARRGRAARPLRRPRRPRAAVSCARSAGAASPPTRCDCCAPRGSPPSWSWRSTRAPPRWPAPRPPARRSRPASASSPSCASCVGGPDPLRGLALLDELGLTAVVLPELEALRGVEQGPNHHLDVHGHTIAVLERTLEVEADLDRFAGDRAAEVRGAAGRAARRRDDPRHGTSLRRPPARHRQVEDSRRAATATSPSSATTAPAPRSSAGCASGCGRAAS